MDALDYEPWKKPLYVSLLVDWRAERTHVEVTTDVVYMLPGSAFWDARQFRNPLLPVDGVPKHLPPVTLLRIERFAALDRARKRARTLARWPVAWCRRIAADPPHYVQAFLLLRITKGGRLPIPDSFLSYIDDTPSERPTLPRRESWYDGERPA